MPQVTLAYVKNIMRRAIGEVLDPSPSAAEKEAIWAYFQNKCAFCDRFIERNSRQGHIDHLVAASRQGPNGVGNRVLACEQCNGSEKRDADWETFLAKKCPDNASFEERRSRILDWQQKFATALSPQEEVIRAAKEVEEVIKQFEDKYTKLRLLARHNEHQLQ